MSAELVARFVKRFPGGVAIAADLCRPADRFSVTVLFGPSGCGKTTTLRCLAGLEEPEAGRIIFGTALWFDAGAKVFLRPQQRDIGYLFQEYALFPHLSVVQNVGYGLGGARAERQRRLADILETFGLSGLEGRYPHQLSGGQQQRVALARVLVRRPRLLLLDEPLAALDAPTRAQLRPELRRLLASFGIPVVLVTHDRAEAMALADHLVVLDQGQVCQQGPAPEVFSRPISATVAHIVGVETVQPGTVLRVQGGLATVRVGTANLVAPAAEGMPGEILVCVRGEEVVLQPEGVDAAGTPNRLGGLVRSLTPEGPLVRVGLDCGFPLVALLTRPACEQLGLHEGQQVTAQLNVSAVHLVRSGADHGSRNGSRPLRPGESPRATSHRP
jgi:molybdate transport system ATP-binding protein